MSQDQPNTESVKEPHDLQVNADKINKAVEAIKIVLCGQQITPINIVRITINSFAIIATYVRPLPIQMQKLIVTQAIEKIIAEQSLSDVEREAIMILIQVTVCEAVDTYYTAEKEIKKCCCAIM